MFRQTSYGLVCFPSPARRERVPPRPRPTSNGRGQHILKAVECGSTIDKHSYKSTTSMFWIVFVRRWRQITLKAFHNIFPIAERTYKNLLMNLTNGSVIHYMSQHRVSVSAINLRWTDSFADYQIYDERRFQFISVRKFNDWITKAICESVVKLTTLQKQPKQWRG